MVNAERAGSRRPFGRRRQRCSLPLVDSFGWRQRRSRAFSQFALRLNAAPQVFETTNAACVVDLMPFISKTVGADAGLALA